MASQLVLLMFSVLKFVSSTDLGICSGGYAESRAGAVSSFPAGTFTLPARSQAECAIQCVQSVNCWQLYYNKTTRVCFVIRNLTQLTTTNSNDGRLIAVPNPKMSTGRSCSNIQCPPGSVCKTDCAGGAYGGPMCVADNSKCLQQTEIMNVKHYYNARYEDESDVGVVHTVNFNKTSSDTAIRVQWYANTRGHVGQGGCCGRHYVTFNGADCSNPNRIDFSNYIDTPNHHLRFSELDGICYGIPAGIVTIAINVGNCLGWCQGNMYTGWDSSRSMWIYEIKSAPSGGATPCPALPVFNTQYFTQAVTNGGDPDTLIFRASYTKLVSDTSLRVKYITTARVYARDNGGYCGRWYVMINGVECNPKAEFVLYMLGNTYDYTRDNHKTRTLEGVCTGLGAGTYTIDVHVGLCYYAYTINPDTETGNVNGIQRLIVDEVRMGTNVQAVMSSTGEIKKLPSFNYQHYSWYLLDNGIDIGNIVSVAYSKMSDTSGLHLHMMGDARVYAAGSCCRWYFTIDGVECSNPGVIEGVSYTDNYVNYHNPGVIDGVCLGILSGSRAIGYNVGTCVGYPNVGDCFTGYGSTLHVMVEEVQPDAMVTCSTPFSCP